MGEPNGFGTGRKATEHILLGDGSVSPLLQLELAANGSIRGRHLHLRARRMDIIRPALAQGRASLASLSGGGGVSKIIIFTLSHLFLIVAPLSFAGHAAAIVAAASVHCAQRRRFGSH